jgi:acyl-coenzyme A thioesterase PaaI-like protein
MTEAFYELMEETDPGRGELSARVRSTVHTTGPWAAGLQHAGPPSALLTRCVRLLGGLPARALPARLTFDILSPVPVADLVVTARTLRPGRKVALAEATLSAADSPDRPVMTLRAWLVRQLEESSPARAGIPATPATALPTAPEGLQPMPRPDGWHPGYLDAIRWLWAEGSFQVPGPAAVWTRLGVDLVEGEDPNPIERLVAVADSASGISAVASPADLVFVNTDLTLHLTRAPAGEEIWMRALTTVDADGIGRTTGELGDRGGVVAHSAQCLFVEPRS